MKIVIVCFDNFIDIDVFLLWDLLNCVCLVGGFFDWDVQFLGMEEIYIFMFGLCIFMIGSIFDIFFVDVVIFVSGKGVKDLYKN